MLLLIIGRTLGEGTFGKVKLGTHILTGEKVGDWSEHIGGGEDLIKGPNQGCGGRGTSDSLNPHFETSTPPLHHPALRNNRDP